MVERVIAQAIASGAVPPEVTADYLMETRDRPAITALIVLTVLTAIVVGTRCVSRLFILKAFGVDDSLAFFSLLLLIAFVALSIILIQMGSGRHIEYIQYVLSQSQTNTTETLDFIAHLIYTTALYFCRISGLAFYLRLCKQHSKLTYAIYAGAVFLTAAFLPQMFLIIFHCSPVTSLWPYAWQPNAPEYVCLMWGTVYVTNSGLSLVCDFVLFTIPIFIIHSLKVSKRRKVQLSLVLLPGIPVIIVSIVRLYLVVKGQWIVDGSWFYNPMLAIETAEIGATLIALSIPGLKPLLGKWFEAFNQSAIPKSHASTPYRAFTRTRGATKLSSADERRSRVPGASDSDDSLVGKGTNRIQARTSVHVDSNSMTDPRDIQLEMHPR